MIHIFYNKSREKLQAEVFEKYMKLLPEKKQEKIKRFRNWQDAQRSLFGNLLLKEGLKKLGLHEPTLDQLLTSEYDRPYFENKDIDFNITHSGEFTLCVLSTRCRVGIDIEEINIITTDEFEELFSESEMGKIKNDESLRYFYTLWTQKEAFLKAIGKGLQVPLNKVLVKNNKITWENKEWFLGEIEIGEGYVSHLCTDCPGEPTLLYKIKF